MKLLMLIYGIGFVYFVLLVLLVAFQRSFIYFPSTEKPKFETFGNASEGYEVISVTTSDGLELNGWYHPAADPDKFTFLWFHGNGSDYANRVYWANYYTKRGYGVILASYRGYGGNPGKHSEKNFLIDADAWVKMVQNDLKIRADKFVLYGESLGTGIAIEMASRYPAFALILQTPYKSLRALAQNKFPIFPIRFVMWDQYDSLSRIKNIKMPVLMIHGTNDEIIPFRHAQQLYEAAPQSKKFVTLKGAGHSNIYDYGTDLAVLNFLEKQKSASEEQ